MNKLQGVFLFTTESSKAKISCTGKGDNFSCLCKGIGGTPPARISWFKNGEKIKGPGYLQATLDKNDFVLGEGVYYCNSTSGQLNDVENITLSKYIIVFIKLLGLNDL